MSNYNKITALYSRLSVGDEDRDGGESNSIHPLLFLLPKMTSTMCCVWAAIQTVKGSVWLQPLKSRKPPLRLPRY